MKQAGLGYAVEKPEPLEEVFLKKDRGSGLQKLRCLIASIAEARRPQRQMACSSSWAEMSFMQPIRDSLEERQLR
jgi:hypothetical protein